MMKNNKINKLRDGFEDHLRRVCGRLSPDARVILVVVMFLFFTGFSLYFTITGIYQFGKGEGAKLNIQHIERLELELKQVQTQLDSVRIVNDFNYEYDRENE